MKVIGLIIVLVTGGLLVYATGDFPNWGDPTSPASIHLSPHFIEMTMEETSVPNIVTAVLADYRGFDTLFETVVIFSAGVACFLLLRTFGKEDPPTRLLRHAPTGVTLRLDKPFKMPDDLIEFEQIDNLWTPYDLVHKIVCRPLIPFIQLFALYVIAHGHHSPGGGFQGGVILGASIILLAISQDFRTASKRIRERPGAILCAIGISIYAGCGALCLLFGLNFLDYSALAGLLHVDPIMARSHGILIVETGVGIAVMATIVWIYNNLSTKGRYDEGL